MITRNVEKHVSAANHVSFLDSVPQTSMPARLHDDRDTGPLRTVKDRLLDPKVRNTMLQALDIKVHQLWTLARDLLASVMQHAYKVRYLTSIGQDSFSANTWLLTDQTNDGARCST